MFLGNHVTRKDFQARNQQESSLVNFARTKQRNAHQHDDNTAKSLPDLCNLLEVSALIAAPDPEMLTMSFTGKVFAIVSRRESKLAKKKAKYWNREETLTSG